MNFETVLDRLNNNLLPLLESYSHLTAEFREREEQLKVLFILAMRSEIMTILSEKNVPKNKWKPLLFSFLANKKFNMAFFQRKIRKSDSTSNENYRYSVLLMLVDMELDVATYKWTTSARKQDLMQTAIEMLWSVSQVTQFDKPLSAPTQEQREVLEQYRLAIVNAMQQLSFLSPASAPMKMAGRKRRIAQVYDSDASDYNSSLESNESDEVASSASSPCPSPVHIAKKFKPTVQEFGTAFSSNPASPVIYVTPNPIFFNPLPPNATLLNPADYMNSGMNVSPNSLNLNDDSLVPSSIHLNFPVPHELILNKSDNNTTNFPSYDAFSSSLLESNFVTYEDIINELFSSNPASPVIYVTPNPIFFNPLPPNATLLNPADYMNSGMNVSPNSLNLNDDSLVPSSIHLNFPVPHELILNKSDNNTTNFPSYDAFSSSLLESNFVTYEDIINELFN